MFNRSEIMKAAWKKVRMFGIDMAKAMKLAWLEAKNAAPIWNVYAEGFSFDGTVVLGEGLTYERACEVEWLHKYRYDRITIKAA